MKIEIEKQLRLEDLEEDKIFDEDELIIERDEERMATLRKLPDDDKIRRYHYNIIEKKGIIQINCNGFNEYFPGDIDYDEFNLRLRRLDR